MVAQVGMGVQAAVEDAAIGGTFCRQRAGSLPENSSPCPIQVLAFDVALERGAQEANGEGQLLRRR